MYENLKAENAVGVGEYAYLDAVLAGHTHKDYDTMFEGIRLVAANPVCNGIGHGRPGFNTVSVNKEGFEIEFHPTPGFDPAKCRL